MKITDPGEQKIRAAISLMALCMLIFILLKTKL